MKKTSIVLFILFVFATCKEKYISPASSPVTGYLVVEGVINAGAGITNIVLKRTTTIDSSAIVFEKKATVFIEGENHSTYNLSESSDGHYSSNGMELNNAIKYRLNIHTLDGKKYQSDYVSVQKTPAIDSVSWIQDSLGAHIFINTHDPSNQTKYYQWEYTETWEYHSPYLRYFKYVPVPNTNGQKFRFAYIDTMQVAFDSTIIKCWQEDYSKSILLGSTISLSNNKILLPLNNIPAGSLKLSVLYSIKTRQYSLSEGRYQYLQKMKKNTESTGTVFDAQPSELIGNIHCISNPSDPVIGYFDICQIQESRIFISNNQLQHWDYKTGCNKIEVLNDVDSITLAKSLGYEPIFKGKEPIMAPPPFGFPGTFIYAKPVCIDCTLTGTNIKPSFWP